MKKKLSILGLLFITSTMFAMDRPVELPKSPPTEDIDVESARETGERHEEEMETLKTEQAKRLQALKDQQAGQRGGAYLDPVTEQVMPAGYHKDAGGLTDTGMTTLDLANKYSRQLQGVHDQQVKDMQAKHKAQVKQLDKQHKAELAGKESRAKSEHSELYSMSAADAYKTLGVRPGADTKVIERAQKKKYKEMDEGNPGNLDPVQVTKALRRALADRQERYNVDGQRTDEHGTVVETWGEKFDRWMQSAKRRFFGSDRATQVAVELAGLNENGSDEEEEKFEAALKELKYQLRRHPGQVDKIANAYLRHVMADKYNDDVIEALQEALPADQELVRERDGQLYEIRQKTPYTEVVDGPPVDHRV